MQIQRLLILLLALMTSVSSMGSARADDQSDVKTLTQNIEAKFGLTAKLGASGSIAFKKAMKSNYILRFGKYVDNIDVAWPIDIEDSKPEETTKILTQILNLPKRTVDQMADAYALKQYEENQMEWNESITAYIPTAFPADDRQSVKGEVYLISVPYITKPFVRHGHTFTSGGSNGVVGEVNVPTTNLALVLKYPGIPVYKKGDLKRAILANEETRTKLVAQIRENMSNFEANRDNDYGYRFEGCNDGNDCKRTVIDWASIVKSYEK